MWFEEHNRKQTVCLAWFIRLLYANNLTLSADFGPFLTWSCRYSSSRHFHSSRTAAKPWGILWTLILHLCTTQQQTQTELKWNPVRLFNCLTSKKWRNISLQGVWHISMEGLLHYKWTLTGWFWLGHCSVEILLLSHCSVITHRAKSNRLLLS